MGVRRTEAMRGTAVVLAAMLLLTAAGCATLQRAGEESTTLVEPYAPTTDGSAVSGAQTEVQDTAKNLGAGEAAVETGQYIIRTRTLRLEVKSTPDAIDELRNLAKTNAAIITDLQVASESEGWIYRYDESGTGSGTSLRGWMTVRVPAENLDAFMESAIGLGTVKYQSEGSEDVTQQHVDMAARLENLRAEEARLRSFFDAAKNVQEMLAIETELNRIRGEIEAMDAQVKYLERQAALATVTVELTEEQPVVRPSGDTWGFSEAITAGFRGAANVITFVIALVIATAPLWALALIAFFVVRAVVRKRRAKRASAAVRAADESGAED